MWLQLREIWQASPLFRGVCVATGVTAVVIYQMSTTTTPAPSPSPATAANPAGTSPTAASPSPAPPQSADALDALRDVGHVGLEVATETAKVVRDVVTSP